VTAPLFIAGAHRAFELEPEDIPALQRFYDANPEYFLVVGGQPARADEASDDFHGSPPPELPRGRHWMIGLEDESASMIGVADVLADFLAADVWHVGLFLVATKLHGTGAARVLYDHLESWMRAQGAQWSRLGVVEGNLRAERFWKGLGYVEVRKRRNVEMGKRVNTLRVMVKPLSGGNLPEYLERVARDRPDQPQ